MLWIGCVVRGVSEAEFIAGGVLETEFIIGEESELKYKFNREETISLNTGSEVTVILLLIFFLSHLKCSVFFGLTVRHFSHLLYGNRNISNRAYSGRSLMESFCE